MRFPACNKLLSTNSHTSPTISVSIILILVLVVHLFTFKNIESALTDVSITFFGIFYIGWLMGHIILLRVTGNGQSLIFFSFLLHGQVMRAHIIQAAILENTGSPM